MHRGERIYVQRSIHAEFLSKFVAGDAGTEGWRGLEAGMDIGPVIGESALASALQQIDDAQKRGAKICCGGKRMGNDSGYFLEPTVMDGVDGDALCMREETFAPIAPMTTFETEEEAIARANNSALRAERLRNDARHWRACSGCAERMEAGTMGINDGAPTTSNAPFGGVKQSGWGRELGSEGLDAFLETKHVSFGGV